MERILYRYCSISSAIRILNRPRLYFSPPRFFNDVTEMCPIISTEIPRDAYLKYFCKDKYLVPLYDTLVRKHSYPAMLQVLRQEAVHNEQLINMICTRIQYACTELEKQFSATMSKHVGVCCFTNDQTSNLMWGHYADSHKGVCIGYSFSESDIILIENKPVEYSDTKAILPPWIIELPENERSEYYSKVAFTKAKEWSYEKEHRFLANLEQCKKESRKCDTYHYQELDKRDIREIIFGIRCSNDVQIRDLIRKKKMKVDFSKCSQVGSSFSLSISTT